MKYLLIILLLFTSFSAFAQNDTTKYYTSTDYGWKWQRGMFKKAFILPSDTINNKLGVANIGNKIYIGNGILWIDVTSTVRPVDTSSLSHRIDLKFNTSDSIGKWLSQGYLSVINGKINIVDTSAMLLAYKNNINSLILDSIYQASQITAIQSVLNSKLNKLDTIYFLHSSDISNFATTSSVSSALNLKVNNSDSTIKYITPTQLNSKGYISNIDSSVWQPKYRVDSMRANIYLTLNGKVNKVDSGRLAGSYVTGGTLNKVKDSVQININSREPAITAPNTIKKYWNGYKFFVALNSDSLTEGITNLFFTNSRAQEAISPGRGWNFSGGVGSIDTTKAYQWKGGITAASAIARGMYWTPTLTASANNDTLIGAYFKPSYSLGSFTGVSKYALGVYGGLYIRDSLDLDYNNNTPLFFLNVNAIKYSGAGAPSFFKVQYLNTDAFALNRNGCAITGNLQVSSNISTGTSNGSGIASFNSTVANTVSDAIRSYNSQFSNSPTVTFGASTSNGKGTAILNVIGWHGLLNTFTVSSPANASTLVSVDTFGNTNINGNLTLGTAGNKLKIAAATNTITATTYAAGTVTLSGGTITVNTTAILTGSKVILTLQNCRNCGSIYLNEIVNTTSFTINSTNALDGSLVYWEIR